jgi:hypothetical protein
MAQPRAKRGQNPFRFPRVEGDRDRDPGPFELQQRSWLLTQKFEHYTDPLGRIYIPVRQQKDAPNLWQLYIAGYGGKYSAAEYNIFWVVIPYGRKITELPLPDASLEGKYIILTYRGFEFSTQVREVHSRPGRAVGVVIARKVQAVEEKKQ